MNPETESTRSAMDTSLLWAAVLIMVGAIVAFYYLETDVVAWQRWAGLGVAAAAGAFLASRTELGRAGWSYVLGARTELRRVVWPTRKESTQTTLLIGVIVLILAVVLWFVDMGLLWSMKVLTGRGS